MDSKIKKKIKLVSINITFFFLLVILFELLFGYWFDKYNFGPYMREHRLKKIPYQMTYNEKEYNYTYIRNSFAFRGGEIDPKKIEIIMVGGSTTDERYKPENLSIVGKLNSKLIDSGSMRQIVNAGVEGQSTFGHIHNFKYWFSRIENFKPSYIIFYIGVNDTRSLKDSFLQDGMIESPNKLDSFLDNIKSRSFLADQLRKIKHKYYNKNENKRIVYDYDHSMKKYKKKYFYLNYEEKLEIYDLDFVKKKNEAIIKKYLKNVDILHNLSKSMGAEPIFINQIMQQDDFAEVLFSINRALISHCNIKNYKCIDLAKELRATDDFWWDGVHTTPKGSEAIANHIFPKLKNFIN